MVTTDGLHPTSKMDLLDLCYYYCKKCAGLFPTIWEMHEHQVTCTGIKVLDGRVHLYAYESVYLSKFVQCCATCTHSKACPFLLEDAAPSESPPENKYFEAIRSLLKSKCDLPNETPQVHLVVPEGDASSVDCSSLEELDIAESQPPPCGHVTQGEEDTSAAAAAAAAAAAVAAAAVAAAAVAAEDDNCCVEVEEPECDCLNKVSNSESNADSNAEAECNPEGQTLVTEECMKSVLKGLVSDNDDNQQTACEDMMELECEIVCDDIIMAPDLEQSQATSHSDAQWVVTDEVKAAEADDALQAPLVKCGYQFKNNTKYSGAQGEEHLRQFLKAIPIEGMTLGVTMFYVCDQCCFKTIHPTVFLEHIEGKEVALENVQKNPNRRMSNQDQLQAKTETFESSADVTKARLVRVAKTVHRTERVRQHKCDMCSRGFTTKGRLNRHLCTPRGERFRCCHCDYTCQSPFALTQHTKEHARKPYTCPMKGCSYQSVHKWKIKVHRQTTHLVKKPSPKKGTRQSPTAEVHYACDECAFTCLSREAIASHLMDHRGLKLWQCVECGFSNRTKAVVLRHVKNRHTEYSSATRHSIVVRLGQTLGVNVEAYRVQRPVGGAICQSPQARTELPEVGEKSTLLQKPSGDISIEGEAGSGGAHHLEVIDLNCIDHLGVDVTAQ